MRDLIVTIEKLLQAYEQNATAIDQGLVSRVQTCLRFCRSLQENGF